MGNLTEKSSIDQPAFKAVAKLHGKFVFSRRMQKLAFGIHSLIPAGYRTVLDVGSGSGEVARSLQGLDPSLETTGLDVLVRDETAIPTTVFDGENIPFPNQSFDVILLIDVLHHSSNPTSLLAECARVAKNLVIIKDHYSECWWDHAVLRVMDWVGNASHDVHLEYRYLSSKQWAALYDRVSLRPVQTLTKINLYPFPLSRLFERHLHFMCALRPSKQLPNVEP